MLHGRNKIAYFLYDHSNKKLGIKIELELVII
jgi:hypothetical protein